MGQCLHSVFEGSVEEDLYEVIVVNDGTPDKSMEIVINACAGHKNVKIVEQLNQGLSSARMTGLAQAEGEYVWFVDSDDWLSVRSLAYICTELSSKKSQVFSFPLYKVVGNNGYLDYIYHDGLFTTKDYLESPCQIFNVQRYVIARQLFDNRCLYFPIGLLHEDIYFCFVLLYLAKDIYVINKALYNYRIRGGSIMSFLTERNLRDMLTNYNLLKSFQKEYVAYDEKSWYMSSVFRSVLPRCYDYAWENQDRGLFGRFTKRYRLFVAKEYLLYHNNKSLRSIVGDLLFILFPALYINIVGEYRVIQ